MLSAQNQTSSVNGMPPSLAAVVKKLLEIIVSFGSNWYSSLTQRWQMYDAQTLQMFSSVANWHHVQAL